jgi:hypothetical protein
MNTQILRRVGHTERRYNPNLFYAGVFFAVLGALAALAVVFWAFQTIIQLLTHQV